MEKQRVRSEVDQRRIDLIARDTVVTMKVRRNLFVGNKDVRWFHNTNDDRSFDRRMHLNEPTFWRPVTSQLAEHLMVIANIDKSVGRDRCTWRWVRLVWLSCWGTFACRITNRPARTKELISIGILRVEDTSQHSLTRMFSMNLDQRKSIEWNITSSPAHTMKMVGTRHASVLGSKRIGSIPKPNRMSQFHSVKFVNSLEVNRRMNSTLPGERKSTPQGADAGVEDVIKCSRS